MLLVFLTGCVTEPTPSVRIDNGVLDLRDLPLDQVIRLKGDWKAFPGQDSTRFSAFDYDDTRWQQAYIPNRFSNQGFPTEGLVWYRLHLQLPPNVTVKGYVYYEGNAHTVFAARPGQEGVELASSGYPALTEAQTRRSRRPVSFTLPQDSLLVLSWKVANYRYQHGGPFHAIELGSADAVDELLLWRNSLNFASFCLYLVIAFFFILNWAWYRRDLQTLAVGLLSLTMMFRTAAISGQLDILFPAFFGFEARILLEAVTFFIPLSLFPFLLWMFFPKEFLSITVGRFKLGLPKTLRILEEVERHQDRPFLPRWMRRLNTMGALFIMVVSVLTTVLACFVSPLVTSHMMASVRWLSLLFSLWAVVIVFQAFERRRPMADGVLLGFVLLLIGGMHDILLSMGLIRGTPYLVGYAFLGFMLALSYVIARRNVRYAKALRVAILSTHEASLAKSRFISAVSHEIRTPLTSVIGYAQILQHELDTRMEPHQREFLKAIRKSGNRLLALVNDLLDLAKAETGRLDLTLTAVSVDSVVAETIQQLYPLAEKKGLKLQGPDQPCNFWVHADELRLRQVLVNLVSNALKFTERGHVTVQISPTVLNEIPACIMTVEDSGVGISPDFLPQIFEPFTQEMRTYNRTQVGTGLGLSLSRDLVERMGGKITVVSELGMGSCFTVALPVAEPAAADESPNAEVETLP